MEWLLSEEEAKFWVGRVFPQLKSSNILAKKILEDLKKYLANNNLYIGPATFTSGFISVLLEACRSDYVNIVQYVLEHHSGQFDINQLISWHHLVPNKIQVSGPLIRRQTLVHAAVENNFFRQSLSLKLLKLLVSHGASVNTPDCCSVTPLLRAVSTYDPSEEIVSYLLKVGANVHYRDMKGQTVLMYAIMSCTDKDIISLLLKAGADATLTDECGYTVLHHAVLRKDLHAIKLLFSFEIPPNLRSSTSTISALFLADRKDFLKKESCLCLRELNPNVITDFVTNHPLCPPQLKVDSILLNASYLFFKNTMYQTPIYQICHDRFKEGLTLRAQLKLSPPTLSEPIEAYGGLTEVTSIEEFEGNHSDLTNITTQVNLAYQCLLIRERCLGYGDSTVIECLFVIGNWMIYANFWTHGLLLWVRATEMLLSRLQVCIASDHSELISLIENGYQSCTSITTSSSETQSFFDDINICQNSFSPVLRNLIMCQQLNFQLCTTIEPHVHSLYHYDHKISFLCLLRLLQYLYKNTNLHNDVSILCREAIDRCPTFPTSSPLHSNLLDLLLTSFDVTTDFLSLLLESGGHIFVNEVGCDGFRPLKISKNKEITSLLLAHGAHPDAVSRPISDDEQFINPHLDDYFSTPLPLACLSARSIVSESIPYQSIDLPSHIKGFIALHDLADKIFVK